MSGDVFKLSIEHGLDERPQFLQLLQALSQAPAEECSADGWWALTPSPPLSRRAYSPQITPKMCLLEWCRREKLAQPVYETVSSWLYPALVQPMHSRCRRAPSPPIAPPGLQATWLEPGVAFCGLVATRSFPVTVALLSSSGHFHKTELET